MKQVNKEKGAILTNPGICAQCDALNRSCCTLRAENNDGLPAPVSGSEINRILNLFPDQKKTDFLEGKINSDQFIRQMELLFPDRVDAVQTVFLPGQLHFELKTTDDACIFKASDGCRLPDLSVLVF